MIQAHHTFGIAIMILETLRRLVYPSLRTAVRYSASHECAIRLQIHSSDLDGVVPIFATFLYTFG